MKEKKDRCATCEGMELPYCTPQKAPTGDWYDDGNTLAPAIVFTDCPYKKKNPEPKSGV